MKTLFFSLVLALCGLLPFTLKGATATSSATSGGATATATASTGSGGSSAKSSASSGC